MKENTWIKRTALFIVSQTVTLFGSSVVQFAIGWHITLTTQSGAMLTIATLCGFLPQAVISLFAGVWADRYDRKKIIMLADCAIALCTAVLAVMLARGYTELTALFVASAIRSVGAGIQTPAVGAFLPELVPEKHLMRVNGIQASVTSIMLLLSPAVAGVLYGKMGIASVLWVDVLTAAVGVGLMTLVVVPKREMAQKEKAHILKDVASGLRYIFKTRWLNQMTFFYLIVALMLGPVVMLTPLMVARSFGSEPWRLAVHEMVFSVGSIVGGVLVSLWGGFKNKTVTMLASSIAFGLTTFVMGFSPNFYFYLGVMVPMGISMPFINTAAMTITQTRVEPVFIGRVFSVITIIGSTAMPLSMVFFGPLADVVSVEWELITSGAVMVAASLLTLRAKDLIAAGEPVVSEIPQETSATA